MQIKNSYSVFQKIELALCLLHTKLICSKARLIRKPFDLRGRKFIDLGRSLTTGRGCRFEAFSPNRNITLRFGENVQVNDYVHICAMESVEIGSNVLMAGHIYISDNSHGSYKGDENDSSPDIPPIKRKYITAPVKIGDNVWLGEHVVILPGVQIGEGSLIGANSVVKENIPPYSIAVGSPARIVKQFNHQTQTWEKYTNI